MDTKKVIGLAHKLEAIMEQIEHLRLQMEEVEEQLKLEVNGVQTITTQDFQAEILQEELEGLVEVRDVPHSTFNLPLSVVRIARWFGKYENQPAKATEIAEALGVRPGTVSASLTKYKVQLNEEQPIFEHYEFNKKWRLSQPYYDAYKEHREELRN